MRYGIREICEVVLKAKSNHKIGNKMFYKGEPVIYFDSLKTSTLEGATTTVYATGGRGNARLMAWEGERTVTFTMEDALISPMGLMILTGAGLVEASYGTPIMVHTVETTNKVTKIGDEVHVQVEQLCDPNSDIYVMIKQGDDIITEPYKAKIRTEMRKEQIADYAGTDMGKNVTQTYDEVIQVLLNNKNSMYIGPQNGKNSKLSATINLSNQSDKESYTLTCNVNAAGTSSPQQVVLPECNVKVIYEWRGDVPPQTDVNDISEAMLKASGATITAKFTTTNVMKVQEVPVEKAITIKAETGDSYYSPDLSAFSDDCTVIVDYYTKKTSGVSQIEIKPDSFGGNFYLEASTLFRATTGEDHPAEFIIPNCKIQSNFNFAMAATGDPSTFTFTMDAFPDYTRFDPTKKVICAIQVIDPEGEYENKSRTATAFDYVNVN